MKKKILFISEALWIGGIETALVNLLNRLDYDRYDVTCLILRDSQEMASRITPKCRLLVADRQHVVSFPEAYAHRRMYNLMEEPQGATALRRLIWRGLCLCLRAPEARRYAAYIRAQLQGEHFDTAIIYSDRAAETAVRAVDADRFLLFYHHGSMRREYHDDLGYRRADKIIAVSEAQARKLREFRSAYADKIIAINNLIAVEDVRRKSRETAQITFPKDQVNLVSCGRLAVEKGVDLAVDACEILAGEDLPGFHWWIIGGGPEEKALRRRAEEKGLGEHMTFLGMQGNPYAYMAQADLFVQPSRIEGHPLTVLEAQVLGLPVLATATDGSKGILADDPAGLLCDISAQGLADALRHLLRHPEQCQEMTRHAAAVDLEAQNEAVMARLYQEIG